ncbi:MAG: hypothetical protein JST87_18595 [Bacteroidetes bacterium]|nr:hypothetical protein [Bacteroidota bacterium]
MLKIKAMDDLQVPENQRKFITDYASLSFKREYREGNAVYYAAFHPEFIDDEGLDQTGRYLIVLLHYTGMYTFHMARQNNRWVIDSENTSYLIAKVGMTRIDWIGACLNNFRK